jgi:SAM-dependent methyltransferase
LDAIETIRTHYSEYLLKLPTETSIFEGIAKMVIPQQLKQCKIAFYAPRLSIMHERIFSALKKRLPECETYVVHSKSINTNSNPTIAIFLNGDYNSIPLRSKYVDLLILEGLPNNKNAARAVEEWHRVLRDNGTLVVIVSKPVFSKFKDPLTIGDFIEKTENQNVSKGENVNGELLQKLLEKRFLKIRKKEMLQMIFLTAHNINHKASLSQGMQL